MDGAFESEPSKGQEFKEVTHEANTTAAAGAKGRGEGMTATEAQWADIEWWATTKTAHNSVDSALLELRQRIEVLEAQTYESGQLEVAVRERDEARATIRSWSDVGPYSQLQAKFAASDALLRRLVEWVAETLTDPVTGPVGPAPATGRLLLNEVRAHLTEEEVKA